MKKIFLLFNDIIHISLGVRMAAKRWIVKYKQYIVPGGETIQGKSKCPLAWPDVIEFQITWQREQIHI